jgi:F-type H+-transporting ATPase subunit b
VGILLPNLIFNIINFFVIMWLLNRFLYRPILQIFAERKQRIEDGLAEAERVRTEAAADRARLESQIEEERRSSQERLRDAVSRSEEAARRRLDEANAEAESLVARARTEAEQIRGQALTGLQGEIAELSVRAAGKVLQAELDASRHRQLIDKFLREELGELA